MTGEGQKAAASHTGSIADDGRTWHALANQTGAILQYDLIGFLNLLSIFQSYPPKLAPEKTQLLLIGNGGGASVLAADQFARNGFPMLEIERTIREKLEDLRLPAGSSVANPIDLPANALSKNNGASIASILDLLSDDPNIGIVIMHLNLTVIAGYDSEGIIGNALAALLALREKLGDQVQIGLVARSDYSPEAHASAMECRRQGAIANIPVFDELPQAAEALGQYRKFSRFQRRRRSQSL